MITIGIILCFIAGVTVAHAVTIQSQLLGITAVILGEIGMTLVLNN